MVSNEDREAAELWELSPDVMRRMLDELVRAREAYVQLYVDYRRGTLDGPMTDDDRVRLARIGAGVWDANYLTLGLVLKSRSSLRSHGWGPRPVASTSDVVNVQGDLFEVIEWDLKDHDIDGDGTHEYTLYAREVSDGDH
jgi:hypothetical protein